MNTNIRRDGDARWRRALVLFALALVFAPLRAEQPAVAGYPTVRPLADYIAAMPVPPADDSVEHQAELRTVLWLQTSASEADLTRTRGEFNFKLEEFSRRYDQALGAAFTAEKWPVTYAFLQKMLQQATPICDRCKDRFQRLRPFGCDPQIKPMDGKNADRLSYPSGHAFRAYFIALVFAELAPEKAAALLRRGQEIGFDRMIAGMHHPSDVLASRSLAALIYQDMHGSEDFRRDLAQAREEARRNLAAGQ